MKCKLYLGFFALLSVSIMVSCGSSSKQNTEITKEDENVFVRTPIVSAKKIETKRSIDGFPEEYQYISLIDGSVLATETVKEGNGKNIVEGKIPDGLVIQYYDDMERVAAELNYNAGKLEGVIKEYFPDGNISFVKSYKAGELNGPVREYYPNGIVKEESNYIRGELNGSLKKYSDSGTLLSRAEYLYNELSGPYKEYFVNGKVKVEIEYLNNKKEGSHKEYDADGILLADYNYSRDKLEGHTKKYYEDGSIQMIANYSDGKQEGETKIFSNNNPDSPIYIDIYKNGKRIKRKAYSKGKLLFTL